MKTKKPIIWLILHGIIVCIFWGRAAAVDKPARVLMLPFQVHAEKDLTFLKKGIFDMLSSRLAVEGKVELINPGEAPETGPEPATEAAAILLAEKLNADYIAFGSLTIFGGSISTDARFIDVHRKKPVVLFNQSGKSHDDVIFHINQFADRINAEVFGRKAAITQTPRPEPPKAVDESRRNPETLFNETGGSGRDYSSGSRGEKAATDFSIWRSQSFSMHIRGMAVGDVDADGNNETVFISDDTLVIYRHAGGLFQKLAEIKGDAGVTFATVDAADINENGVAEIFVTAEDSRGDENANHISKRLRSFVLEWSGKEYVRIAENLPWYFRVIRAPGRGHILLGQQRGFDTPFSGGVYAMAWRSDAYEPADRQRIPKHANVFSFTYGDVTNSGKEMILSFSPSDRLRLYNSADGMEWESVEQMGGSALYFEAPSPGGGGSGGKPLPIEQDHHYLAQRILLTDLDKDGKNEVIVVNNKEGSLGKLFGRFRSYKSGHIECLFWDTLGLYPKWKTRVVSGYISDYAVADFDNDGSPELVFSVDADPDPFLKQPKSYLVSWKLKPPPQK